MAESLINTMHRPSNVLLFGGEKSSRHEAIIKLVHLDWIWSNWSTSLLPDAGKLCYAMLNGFTNELCNIKLDETSAAIKITYKDCKIQKKYLKTLLEY